MSKNNSIKKALLTVMTIGYALTFFLSCNSDITVEKGTASLYIRSFAFNHVDITLSGENLTILSSKKASLRDYTNSVDRDFGTSPTIKGLQNFDYVVVEFEWTEDVEEDTGLSSFLSDARGVGANDLELTLTISLLETTQIGYDNFATESNGNVIQTDTVTIDIKDQSGTAVNENRYFLDYQFFSYRQHSPGKLNFMDLPF